MLDRSGRGRLLLHGKDRASFLQGLLTNDIAALGPGQGCYAAWLTPQGRMITDLWVYELGDEMLLVFSRQTAAAMITRLDRLVFAEDVRFEDATAATACVGVIGPNAATLIGSMTGLASAALAAMPLHANQRLTLSDHPAVVVRTDDAGVDGFDLHVEASRIDDVVAALNRAGALRLDESGAEALRIEAGIPAFGVDMDEDTIPLEAGIESRAISFTKGCYVGQEVIVRVLHRGHGRVAKRLVGITFEAAALPPAAGTPLLAADGRNVGRLTSSTVSPAIGRPIALGYVHRDLAEVGTPVTAGGQAGVVTALPFVS